MCNLVHAAKRKVIEGLATGDLKFALHVTSSKTAGDFLHTKLTIKGNHTFRYFTIHTRKHLGLPVTDRLCFQANCDGVEVTPNESHAHHVPGRVTNRHELQKFAWFERWKKWDTSAACNHEWGLETPMTTLGFSLRPHFVAPEGREGGKVCDIWQRNKSSNHVIAYDVVCVHPDKSKPEEWQACYAAERAAQRKKELYAWFVARESDLIPLATDTYGGFAKSTWLCMHRQAAAAANNDVVLQGKLVRRARDQIATAIVLGQGRLIDEWNRKNRLAKGCAVTGTRHQQ